MKAYHFRSEKVYHTEQLKKKIRSKKPTKESVKVSFLPSLGTIDVPSKSGDTTLVSRYSNLMANINRSFPSPDNSHEDAYYNYTDYITRIIRMSSCWIGSASWDELG